MASSDGHPCRRIAAIALAGLLLFGAVPAAHALISYLGHSQAAASGTNSTVSVGRPTITLGANGTLGGTGLATTQAAVGVGDFLIAVITLRNDDRTVTPANFGAPAQNWTALAPNPVEVGNLQQYVFWRFATVQDLTQATYTFNVGGGSTCWTATIAAYRGVRTVNPIDVSGFAAYGPPPSSTTTRPIASAQVTTGVDDARLIVAWGVRRRLGGAGFTPPAGIDERSDITGTCSNLGPGHALADVTQANAGLSAVYTAVANLNGSDDPESLSRTIALAPAAVPAPVARYAFDEASWNGTANEVRNSAGATANGQASCSGGGCSEPTTTLTNARFCRSGQFNGSTQYVNVPTNTTGDTTLDITGNLTVTAWIRPDTLPGSGLMSIASKNENYEFHIAANRRINWWWDGAGAVVDLFTPNNVINSNAWYHLALVFTRGMQIIYVDGVEVTRLTGVSDADSNENLAVDTGAAFQIAQDQVFAGRYFDGLIDEVRVYPATLSEDDVNAIYTEVPPCTLVDHYRVQHSTAGVNCQAENVTITAHDAAHNPVTLTNTTTIAVTAQYVAGAGGGSRGDWTLVSGGGTLANGAPDDGVATYTFPAAGASTAVLALKDTWAQTVNVVVSDGTATDTSGTASADAGYNQNLTFNAAGFRFVDGGNNLLPNQVAGVASGTLYLQAIQSSACGPTGACTGVCTVPPGFASGTSVTIELASQCVNPVTCQAGQQVSITNNGTSVIAANPASGVTAYTSKSLLFGANGQAGFTLSYPDLGAVALHARYNLPLGTGGASSTDMAGASNAFVVRPYSFVVSNVRRSSDAFANPAAANAAGPAFMAAGEDFTAVVTAVNAAGVATPNYGRETTAEGARLVSSLAAGLGLTDNPPLVNDTGFAAFTAGAATGTAFQWREAGIITLSAAVADGDYLGAGGAFAVTQSGNVGRFIPHHFVLSAGSTLVNRVASGCAPASGFTYMDEGIGLQFRLTAVEAGGNVTRNYATANAFAKLPASPGSSGPPASTQGYGALSAGTPLSSRLDLSVSTPLTWAAGQADVSTTVALRRAVGVDGPYDALRIGIAPSDADGVQLQSSSYDMDTDGVGGNDRAQIGAQTSVRFGRLRVNNALGSQLLDLPVGLEAQYFNGIGFVVNASDGCTSLPRNGVIFTNFQSNLSACETSSSPSTDPLVFSGGRAVLRLARPTGGSDNNAGSVDLKPRLSGAETGTTCLSNGAAATAAGNGNLPYLQFNWGGGSFDQNPIGRATFGLSNKTEEFIYYRESY